MADENNPEITGKFYTSARRFKQVLGSLPDGTKIPGGPYTYTQVIIMLVTLVLGWLTRGIWGTGGTIGDLLILLSLSVGLGYLVGQLPTSRRNPLKLMGSAYALLAHPGAGGRHKGQGLKLSPRAKKIQRDRKAELKAAAKAEKKAAKKGTPEPQKDVEPAPAPAPVMPAGYGSSLNRLLAENDLIEAEGKH